MRALLATSRGGSPGRRGPSLIGNSTPAHPPHHLEHLAHAQPVAITAVQDERNAAIEEVVQGIDMGRREVLMCT